MLSMSVRKVYLVQSPVALLQLLGSPQEKGIRTIKQKHIGTQRGKMTSEENKKEAERIKQGANDAFKAKKYPLAIEEYTKAIELDPTNHVYYGNRAFAHIKIENFGSAILDANTATELNPKYVKAYYRRADANLALGKVKQSLVDFRR